MMFLVVGCNHRTAPVALRERLAIGQEVTPRALDLFAARCDCEALVLNTCNRVELYLARPDHAELPPTQALAEYLAEFHRVPASEFSGSLYEYRQTDAINHLFRVVASLDSMIVGEGQITAQVKRAYEMAHEQGAVGPVLHALFQHALNVAKRVRRETGIAKGHVSISSTAVDYVSQVFDHFSDKTILVIGAGKMGELTLRHLKTLGPRQICVTNRSPEKAEEVAKGCSGRIVAWERLDDALATADIVLSTTGAPEPIVSLARYERIRARRAGAPLVILDIAVPRDFDSRIHDGESTCLFNIDDLQRVREQTLHDRQKHVAAAEAIVAEELQQFLRDWKRRRHGPVIARLTRDFEAKRQAIMGQLLSRLNGKLSVEDRDYIDGAFRLLQNQFLHGPITALTNESHENAGHTLLEALRKLFRLHD
jgi:glutamyl-tRNA reductase